MMKTSYTKDQLETLLMKLENRPNDGVKSRIMAIKATLDTMNVNGDINAEVIVNADITDVSV